VTLFDLDVPRPKLDRVISPRSRSAEYPIGADPRIAAGIALRDVEWSLTPDYPLDQGVEGACVGFGCSAELSAEPQQWPTGNGFARQLFTRAQARDAARGYLFPNGATVLGGLESARDMGLIQGFRWAQSFDDIALGLMVGPVVMGTDVTASMYATGAHAEWIASGEYIGGHCWAIIGYRLRHELFGEPAYWAINSWGPSFGANGRMWVRESTMRRLWDRAAEAAIVTDSPITPTPAAPAVTPAAPSPTPRPSPTSRRPARPQPWWWNPRRTAAAALRGVASSIDPRRL
jgi:hypothetical protein